MLAVEPDRLSVRGISALLQLVRILPVLLCLQTKFARFPAVLQRIPGLVIATVALELSIFHVTPFWDVVRNDGAMSKCRLPGRNIFCSIEQNVHDGAEVDVLSR